MKILFYDTQSYDRESFDRTKEQFPEIEVEYLKTGLAARTASLAKGYDAVCAFVNSDVGTKTVEALHEAGVKLILMRCAGFNNVDLKTAAKYGIDVRRVPGYSPEAVAEHAMTLAMTVNRHMHKAYTKVRENDFSLGGLMGFNFYQKTAGIVGTGKIGAAMARICRGFGMKVIAYDVYQNESLKDFVTYVTLDELLAQSDLISLHCPLMDSTYHMINRESIKKMKDGVILVNTSRGGLVKTDDLIEGIRARKFFGVGLLSQEYIDPVVAASPQEAFYAPKKSLPLRETEGMVCSEFVMCYPPGIPILAPGERITKEILNYIEYAKAKGCSMTGPEDPDILHLNVLA